MMRSLFSGVAGLKTHQTRMDVIGNNIANVNTVGFKSSSANFTDTFYQTISSASGPNAQTSTAGVNAKQIGLGSSVASITTNITEQGGTQTTNRALDVAINGDAFLIVKSGGATYFTKSGALNVDADGTLYCTTNGATVQGWLADADGNIVRDSVRDLKVMSEEYMYSPPTATANVTLTGNVDKNDKNLPITSGNTTTINTQEGFRMTFTFFDRIGEEYTVQMYLQETEEPGAYNLVISDVLDSNGESLFVKKTVTIDPNTGIETTTYSATGVVVQLGAATYTVTADNLNAETGKYTVSGTATGAAAGTVGAAQVLFDAKSGEFLGTRNDVAGRPGTSLYSNKAILFDVVTVPDGSGIDDTFSHYDAASDLGGVEVDVSYLTQYSQGGVANTSYYRGTPAGLGGGNVAGELAGISIDQSGKIIGTYTNGDKRVLAQLAVTTFSNPSGLEAVGDSLFAATLNSGLFDGVGMDITSGAGKFTVGALEMSNVDLSTEFTQMIITQRGFQANSRIITTSDSMLEELVNLKR
ncbi:MAG: flagellar hook-basal body complex protein [Lachnospiraceae bacterium]|nr:flagellar hook-basal body complex protein [Lachnospiraceae bacterium]